MFRKKMHRRQVGDQVKVAQQSLRHGTLVLEDEEMTLAKVLEAAERTAHEVLLKGAVLAADPDDEIMTVKTVLEVGPEIECENAGLPAEIAAWVRRQATQRVAVAYAHERSRPIARGDHAVTVLIGELSDQPAKVQAHVLDRAAELGW